MSTQDTTDSGYMATTENTNTEREALMKLADAYADASFDQGLHHRKLDDKPEEAREELEEALSKALEARASLSLPESLNLAVDRWFAENTGLGGCSDKDVRELGELFYGVAHEGGRESVDDALAVVESFGPEIAGLNDTYARQILLANEVKRLRASLSLPATLPEGISRDDTVHGETYFSAADMATAAAQGFRDGQASLSLPAAGQEPVAHLWQHGETGRTRIVLPDMIVDADASWQVVGPLYLDAAPQPAVAAGREQIAEAALRKVLAAVQRYLPPDGPDVKDTLSEIIEIVDPWPLGPLEK